MAAEDAAVVVTLRANLKDYEAALKSAVRSTERAARAAEAAVSGIGRKASAAPISTAFQKSAGQMASDARILQYQLNDIFSGVASGQGIRAVQMQLGQIAQQLGGQGIGSAARVMGSALVGMINPINLAVAGFGILATVAASYFSDSEEGAEKATKALEAQLDALRKVADAYDMPELARYAAEQQRALDIAKDSEALRAELVKIGAAIDDVWKNVDLGDALSELFVDIGQNAGAAAQDIQDELLAAITKFQQAQAEGVGAQEAWNALVELAAGFARQYGGETSDATSKLDAMTISIQKQLRELKLLSEAQQTVSGQLGRLEVPRFLGGAGGPGGLDMTINRQVEAAAEARKKAERDARDAAREAERASERTKREAERAAQEAAEALNKAIANQTKVAVDAVTGMLGMSENTNAAEINAFLKRGGIDLDSATTAWCAAFVNSALAQVGIKGSGSQAATSFMNWGQGVDLGQIQRGDVLVQPRGRSAGERGGHVGFATGNIRAIGDEIVQVEMISGNSSEKVQTQWVDASEVIARRTTEAMQLSGEAMQHLSDEAAATAAASKKAMEDQRQAAMQFNQAMAGIIGGGLSGFVQDLMAGEDAGDAFAKMLQRIASQMADLVIQMLIIKPLMNMLLGGGTAGVPTAHGGGSVSHLAGVSHRQASPAMFAAAPRYARGGMVGLQPGEVPIIAHRGERIIPKSQLGRVQGGAMGGETTINNQPRIRIDMQRGVVTGSTQDAKALGEEMNKAIQVVLVRESRPGGLLRRPQA